MTTPLFQDRPVTVDGYNYRVVATDLPGLCPVAILVDDGSGTLARLTIDGACPANEGYGLAAARRAHVRYFNVYRAADGSFCFGRKSYGSNEARTLTNDSHRALFGLRLEWNESTGALISTRV